MRGCCGRHIGHKAGMKPAVIGRSGSIQAIDTVSQYISRIYHYVLASSSTVNSKQRFSVVYTQGSIEEGLPLYFLGTLCI